jgi:hypothetical protein
VLKAAAKAVEETTPGMDAVAAPVQELAEIVEVGMDIWIGVTAEGMIGQVPSALRNPVQEPLAQS